LLIGDQRHVVRHGDTVCEGCDVDLREMALHAHPPASLLINPENGEGLGCGLGADPSRGGHAEPAPPLTSQILASASDISLIERSGSPGKERLFPVIRNPSRS
jgi:hypothetical protein